MKTNIIAIRPRSEMEIKEASPSVIACYPEKREVQLKVTNEKTTARTYSFDRVFDGTSTQSQIFQEVVRPMMEEVLLGYSCTIFAFVFRNLPCYFENGF